MAMSSIEGWRRIKHASVVSVREAFTTKSFGDSSLVFVYDYHPLATTLSAKYFVVSPLRPGAKLGVPEKSLWSYIIQISSAIKTLHSAGLAARILEPSKILVTGKNRVRLNCCGIFDMINFDGGKNVIQFQQDDLVNFGRLIVALACGSLAAVHNLPKSLEYISRQYSIDLKNVILLLLSKRSNYKSIDEVLTMIMPRVLQEANSANSYNDILEAELLKETENGRVVRLLSKLGFINERPEFDMDPSWSETGDRYLLKLFRDYVFHQVDELGNPVVDIGHVLQCLNKLDAGVDEKIMLMSRDEQSCLITFVHKRNTNTLTWTSAYSRLSSLNSDIPKLVTRAWDDLPESKPQLQQPSTPSALLIDPSRRYGHLKPCPSIPSPPSAPRESFRYGQKVILVNSSTKSSNNKPVPEACLTFDSWTKIGPNYRLMVSTHNPHNPVSRTVFEITPFDRDSDSHNTTTEAFGNVLTYGSRFRLTTVVGGKEVAVCCPLVSINNLPGGGEGNQALVLSESIWDMSCVFVLEPLKVAVERGVFKEPVVDRHQEKEEDGFVLTCVAGKRVVTSHRERKLLSLLGGDVYSVVSAQITGTYMAPSAMSWKFVSVDK
ncbi:UNVERIFIED_CONTAM: PAB-dependent poly(A)-specific ribonuclease subunit 3 [Siphonaria sp. JEL0065]|nr:PAB-dependent poly(A)-specific ribonuclease subunit 3 [Siphonaria sp. JEL0065]